MTACAWDAETVRRERDDIARAVAGQTVCSLFQEQVARRADEPALYSKRAGAWRPLTWREYGERVRAAALALAELGLEPGERVALLSGTREEYNLADLGVTHAGGVTVALYQTLAPSQIAWIVDHAVAAFAVAENAAQAEKVLKIRGEIPGVRRLVVLEDAEAFTGDPWVVGFEVLLSRGAALAREAASAFDARWRAIKPDSLLTLAEAALAAWAAARGLAAADRAARVRHPELRAEVQRHVDAVNADRSRPERIKAFAVLAGDWGPDTGELTPTLKVRRKVVLERYRAEIDALYGG